MDLAMLTRGITFEKQTPFFVKRLPLRLIWNSIKRVPFSIFKISTEHFCHFTSSMEVMEMCKR